MKGAGSDVRLRQVDDPVAHVEPDLWGPVDGLPTYGRALVDRGALDRLIEEVERVTDLNEKYRIHDE